jgi:WD40 repeat protein
MAIDRTQTITPAGSADTVDATPRSADEGDLRVAPHDASDRYELEAEHGRGGIGRVVRAHDRHLGRTVAVKELLRTNELAEALFVREAMITARLQHPGIVPVHEAGRWPNGDPYYVMKMVSGRTLKEVIGGTQSLADRLALLPHVIAVAEAVGYAHSQDVIHRDLKPANVLLGEYGETIVIDWGLARDLRASDVTPQPGAAGSGDGRTVTGRVVGTPQYMSPEQARGDAVDARADVYALGAMLYEVLTGRAPVGGESAQQIIDRVLAGPPEPLRKMAPGVPADLDAIVGKAMARAPADRYATARELAADLKRFQTGQLVTAQVYGRWSLTRRWVHKNRGYVALGTVAVTALAMIAIGLVRRVVEERTIAEARGRQAQLAAVKAEARSNDLVLAQAQAAIPRDPTAALAWLKNFPVQDDAYLPGIAAMVEEAEAAGIAKHVWRGADWVIGVAVSREGSKVATAVRDGKVRVYDAVSGELRILGQRPMLGAVTFDALGQHLLTAESGGPIWRWDIATAESKLMGTHDSGEPVMFEPAADGLIASRSTDGTIKLWDVERGDVVDELFGELPYRERTATAWDGRRGVLRMSGGVEGKLALWNGENGHDVAQLPGPVRKLSMTHDGKRALAADTKSVYWVDVEHGKVVKVADGMTKVQMLTIDPTERRAAIAGNDSDVILVDVATGAVERRRGHTDALYGALFDSRGERLITPSDDGTIRVWDLDTGDSRVLRGHDDDVYAAAITPDGRTVASASLDGSARLWRVGDRKTVVVGQLGDVRNMSPLGGDRVRVVSQNDPVRVTDVDLRARTANVRYAADSKVADSDISADGSTVVVPVRPGHVAIWRDGGATEMDFPDSAIMARLSGDGRRAVSLEVGGEVKLFDDDHVKVLRDKSPTTSIALRKDGQRVALVGPEAIEVLDASSGASIAQLPRAAHSISNGKLGVEFMPDGRHVVVQDLTGLRLWNVESGSIVALERSMYGHPKMAQSPDGAMIAVGVEDRSVRLWDVKTGRERRTLRGHRDLVNSIAFSPDGKRLATGSYDKSVRVWDVQTGDGRVLSGHVGPVWTVAWIGPDQIASGSSDGTVRLWTLPVTPPPRADEIATQLRKETSAMIDESARPTTPTPTPTTDCMGTETGTETGTGTGTGTGTQTQTQTQTGTETETETGTQTGTGTGTQTETGTGTQTGTQT